MNLASLLLPEAVLPRISARDKKQVLKQLAAEASRVTGLSEREVFSVLQARENLGCTGMGGGVSIPHGRFEGLKAIHAIFATLDDPIEFGAADGRPVDIICLLLTPAEANTEHLKALAVISRLLRDKALCATIRDTSDAKTLHALITADRSEK